MLPTSVPVRSSVVFFLAEDDVSGEDLTLIASKDGRPAERILFPF